LLQVLHDFRLINIANIKNISCNSLITSLSLELQFLLISSPIAQLVEQLTVNQWVAGSSPAWGASIGKGILIFTASHIPQLKLVL
tara:strand:- start:385 stop:639 length:255 start_codon:yes stop_codon:yes gene_type:complete